MHAIVLLFYPLRDHIFKYCKILILDSTLHLGNGLLDMSSTVPN